MTDELKPCPFCKTTPCLDSDGTVVCPKCNAFGPDDAPRSGETTWNTRPIEDALKAEALRRFGEANP